MLAWHKPRQVTWRVTLLAISNRDISFLLIANDMEPGWASSAMSVLSVLQVLPLMVPQPPVFNSHKMVVYHSMLGKGL